MKKLLKYLSAKEKGMALTGILFVAVQVWLELKMPEYMSGITLLVQTPGSEINEILQNGGYMLLCALGSMAASIATGYFAARVAASLAQKLRSWMFRKVMGFYNEELGRFSTASLITRSTNDITQVQMLVAMGLQIITKTPIMMFWGITKIIRKQWQWSLTVAAAVLVISLVILLVAILVLPRFQIIQALTDDLNRVARENLTGIRVIRAYHAEKFQQGKFEQVNTSLTDTNLFANRVTALLMPTMTLVTSGISLAIYWIGAYLLDDAAGMERLAIFSDMVVFSQYAMQVIMAFAMMTVLFVMLPRVMVSVHRINEVLDTEVKIKSGTQDGRTAERTTGRATGRTAGRTAERNGSLEFRHVSFRYPGAGEDVLHDISFTVYPGETVAIIGATGSGKSTLVNLLLRYYDVTVGEILIDGIRVQDYEIHALREKLGYVSQKAVLFSGSVASNVAMGKRDATEEEVGRALSVSQSEGFVSRMTGGMDGEIAQGGVNVSGGQRQRLSIARAVCKDPEIYIFDDSFSALDYKTDRLLRQELERYAKRATKLIVAQRIGTIRHADNIIVLADGKIAGMGTHAGLLKSCQVYQEIARSQMSEEELRHG